MSVVTATRKYKPKRSFLTLRAAIKQRLKKFETRSGFLKTNLNQTLAKTCSNSGLHWITKNQAATLCWLLRFKVGHLIHNILCTQPLQRPWDSYVTRHYYISCQSTDTKVSEDAWGAVIITRAKHSEEIKHGTQYTVWLFFIMISLSYDRSIASS
jgi:hypothetical protein